MQLMVFISDLLDCLIVLSGLLSDLSNEVVSPLLLVQYATANSFDLFLFLLLLALGIL